MAISIADLEDAVAARVEALSTEGHRQGSTKPLTWRRSPIPLTASTDRQLWDHLSFSATLENVVPSPGHEGEDGGPDQFVRAIGELRVPFVYRIRSAERHSLDDAKGASRAAEQVMAALLWDAGDYAASPMVLYRPGPIGSEFMTVDLRLAVLFDLSLPRPSP